jgi:hypothetical protein
MNKAKINAILLVIITIVSTIGFFIVVPKPEQTTTQPWINSPYGSFVTNFMCGSMKWSIYQYNSTQYFGVSDWAMYLTVTFQSVQEVENAIQKIQSGLESK